MSDAPVKPPSRRGLMLFGTVAVVAFVAIAVSGVMDRAHSERELAQWTDDQAVPTVLLAKIVKGGSADSGLVLPGTIQPFYKATIFARVSGYLKSWNEDIGAHVKAGQVLAVIDTPDLDQQLDQAKANLASAVANAKLAALTAKRWQALVSSQSVSRQEADERAGNAAAREAQVDAAQADVRRIEALENFKTIVAPFDGVVTSRDTDIGALINAGSGGRELFTVSDLHKVRIYVNVPQAYMARLHTGMTADLQLPQYPGRNFPAVLVTTAHAVSEASRNMLFELQADNADGLFSAGLYTEVRFNIPPDPNVLRVPATALIVTNKGVSVAALEQGGQVRLKPIEIGRDEGDTVEVTAGLSATDKIIDNPPETLETGMTVRLAEAKAGTTAAPETRPNEQSRQN
jgi:RND family efflux transporter MFP subunit